MRMPNTLHISAVVDNDDQWFLVMTADQPEATITQVGWRPGHPAQLRFDEVPTDLVRSAIRAFMTTIEAVIGPEGPTD